MIILKVTLECCLVPPELSPLSVPIVNVLLGPPGQSADVLAKVLAFGIFPPSQKVLRGFRPVTCYYLIVAEPIVTCCPAVPLLAVTTG